MINLLAATATPGWRRHWRWGITAVGLLIVACLLYRALLGTDPPGLPVSAPADSPPPTLPALSQQTRPPLEFSRLPLADALRTLGKAGQQNVIVSHGINGSISLSLQDAPPATVLDTLIRQFHLNTAISGNLLFVSPPRRETCVFHIQYASAEETAGWLHTPGNGLLSRQGSVHVDTRTSQIVVTDFPENLQKIEQLLHYLDTPVQQVLIETRIASIDRHFERELGVDFSVSPVSEHNDVPQGPFSLAMARLAGDTRLDIRLAALEQAGHAEFVSSPRLFTANHQAASIETGEEIPYQEISRSGATGIAFRKAVLSLDVVPHIMPGQRIWLQLRIHQDKPASRIVMGVPAISTRQIRSGVMVRHGETVVLGGIFETTQGDSHAGLPFLNRIPLVKHLFQQQVFHKNQREMLVFVTPRIIPAFSGPVARRFPKKVP